MNATSLAPFRLNLADHCVGQLQRTGPLSVLPIFTPDAGARFVPPLSGLKLSRVDGYGNVELRCRENNPDTPGADVAIVPLHVGYIQDKAQNHALCRSALIGGGQRLMFRDACCVQEAQGGYMEGRDQWFFILPLQLRHEALTIRGTENYGKLWSAISRLNNEYGYANRGHLEQVVCHKRFYLTQYVSRLERLPGQTGAIFFINGRLVGIEIAPTVEYFAELWMPLVAFCYGAVAMAIESAAADESHSSAVRPQPFEGISLAELTESLDAHRRAERVRALDAIASVPASQFETIQEERFLDLELVTTTNDHFSGQVVEEAGTLVYASISARPEWLRSAMN